MTEAEIAALFRKLDVLQTGHFKLSSGAHSDTYLQCALALQEPRVALRLGQELAGRVAERHGSEGVDVVASPALGGVLAGFAVAAALGRRFVFAERRDGTFTFRRGQEITPGERVLIVEDVITTGGSALEVGALVAAAGGHVVAIASIVDRSGGLPAGRRPDPAPLSLLQVAPGTWEPARCPLCADGDPLTSPGSRQHAM
jgi:orotate phosphoribosyltransferase